MVTDTNLSTPKQALKPSLIVADLNQAYLRAVIAAWEDQNIALLEYFGVTAAFARDLAAAPSSVISRFSQFRSPLANFTGDQLKLERLLQHQLTVAEDLKKVDEMITLGATLHHIYSMTGISNEQLIARARALGIKPTGSRTPLMKPHEHALADEAWKKYRYLDEIDHWIAMARETGIPIRVLHATYRNYQTPMPGRRGAA